MLLLRKNKAHVHNTSNVLISKPYTTTASYSSTLVQAGIEVRQGVLAKVTFFTKA